MKKIINPLVLVFLGIGLISCVQDGDFTLPTITEAAPIISVNSSIKAAKSALKQAYISNGNVLYTFPEISSPSDSLYLEAYVISSDAAGNFYKKMIVQDKAENPTDGIEILINKTSLSETFNIGRKVYVLLNGLSILYDDGQSESDPTDQTFGKYTLGIREGNAITEIPATSLSNHIIRSNETATIVPSIIELGTLQEQAISTMVRLVDSQFEKSILNTTFSGDVTDEFDGFRNVVECNSQKRIPLQSSTYASFKSNVLPQGRGLIDFVLSKDYFSSFLVAIVNSPSAISFDTIDRCDPVVLACEGSSGSGTVLMDEGFENIKSTTSLEAAGWSNVNVSGGNTIFTSKAFGGNRYLQIGAYNTGENPLEAWLVSPQVSLESTDNEVLTFDTNTGYDNGKALTVYVSSDYVGDVTTATWVQVDAVLSEGPTNGYNSFTSSGEINLSCLSGFVNVAFKYSGGDGAVTTTFQIDNVKIEGE